MAIQIKVPTVGESITEITIANWLKKDGDTVKLDEVIAELESDKATFELTATADGVLKIVKPQGSMNEDGTGYFKNNFIQQVKTAPLTKDQTVTSSIFKTQSGWQDGKYYMLINGVEPGTIVKITNPSNSKTVYAKVLYSMEKIRENQGVDIRISDAAASSLAVSETDKFILKVNY